MIYQIHTGEVINVETLEDIRGWFTDDIYEIATDLFNREISEREDEIGNLEADCEKLMKKLKNITKLGEKYLNDVETKELSKRQLLTRFNRILEQADL